MSSQWIGIVIILIGIFYPIYRSSKTAPVANVQQNDLS